MTATEQVHPLVAARQEEAAARARIADLHARAALGEDVSGLDLVSAEGDLKLAGAQIPVLEAQEKAAAESERKRMVAGAVAEFRDAEPAVAAAFVAAVEKFEAARRVLLDAGDAHAVLVNRALGVAKAYAPDLPGEAMRSGGFHGRPTMLADGGYRGFPVIHTRVWLDRLVAGTGTADLYPSGEGAMNG